MQLPGLLYWTISTPADNDPFTMDFTQWLTTIPGDKIASVATVSVTNSDGTAQTSLACNRQALDTTQMLLTMWLTGGIVGSVYTISASVTTAAGRVSVKSANLIVEQFKS